MSATTLVSPELEEALEPRKDAEHLLHRNGNGGPQRTLPVSSAAELKKLDEGQLKAAIESTWKKYERLAKDEMGELLYFLRENLRAQGSRNDLRDQDKGFGAWVEETIEISRRTADRWADEYGLKNGLIERKPKPTSGQADQKSFVHEDDDFQAAKRRKHGRLIQVNYWATVGEYQQHEEALDVLKKHFKTTRSNDAIVKGVQYAAQTLTTLARRTRKRVR